jgi:hypothetical protein
MDVGIRAAPLEADWGDSPNATVQQRRHIIRSLGICALKKLWFAPSTRIAAPADHVTSLVGLRIGLRPG